MIRAGLVAASVLLQVGVEAKVPERAASRPARVLRERAGPARVRPVTPAARRAERVPQCLAPAVPRVRGARR